MTDSYREAMKRQEAQVWSKRIHSVKSYSKASGKTEETRKGSSNLLHAEKTYIRTNEQPDETENVVPGGSKPGGKADSEPTEKTPEELPPSQVN